MDTDAKSNILHKRTFRSMFANKVDSLGLPLPDTTQKEATILTAYNGSNITQHGSVCTQCAYKGKWTTLKFFVVTLDRPTIIGFPSRRDLDLISIHSAIQKTQDLINSINSTSELINSYPDQFDRIGHIVLKPVDRPYERWD